MNEEKEKSNIEKAFEKAEAKGIKDIENLIAKLKSEDTKLQVLPEAIEKGIIKACLKVRTRVGFAYFQTINPEDLKSIEDLHSWIKENYGGGEWEIEYQLKDTKPPFIVYTERLRFAEPYNERVIKKIKVQRELEFADNYEDFFKDPILEKKEKEKQMLSSEVENLRMMVRELQEKLKEKEKEELELKHRLELENMRTQFEERIKSLEQNLQAKKPDSAEIFSKTLAEYMSKIVEAIQKSNDRIIEFYKTALTAIPRESKTDRAMEMMLNLALDEKKSLNQQVQQLMSEMVNLKTSLSIAELEQKYQREPSTIETISQLLDKGADFIKKLQISTPKKLPDDVEEKYARTIANYCNSGQYKEAMKVLRQMIAEMNYHNINFQDIYALSQKWGIKITPELQQAFIEEFFK